MLADERAEWRPAAFNMGLWGCTLDFRYPVAKLADWRDRQDELAENDNPFATVILAHLAAQETRRDMLGRQAAKLALVRRLYERGYSRERVVSLFRFIDWLLALPAEGEMAVRQAIAALEEERQMPYITSIERMGIERGLAQGREEGREEGREQGREQGQIEGKRTALQRLVRARFGSVPEALAQRLEAADEQTIDLLLDRVLTAPTAEDLK